MSVDFDVAIVSERDIVAARQKGRELAAMLGFGGTDQTLIATAISEIARNIVRYAGSGRLVLSAEDRGGRRGLTVVATDQGPGIDNVEAAMRDGYSTGNSLGLGLPGAKRIMDAFSVDSTPGVGTTVTMTKWLR